MRRNLQQKIMIGFLSVMLIVGMTAGIAPITAYGAEMDRVVEQVGLTTTDNVYTYDVYDDGTATITHYYKDEDTNSNNGTPEAPFEIPSTIGDDAIPVTEIGTSAFSQCSKEYIKIPEGVTSIGDRAFQLSDSLKGITIPEGVTSIGAEAFYRCRNLSEVTIPSTVKSIGHNAFQSCSDLAAIAIPEGVTSIADCTFDGCSDLKNITIPSTVKTIEMQAFSECDALTKIEIPFGVKTIGNSAFYGCQNLESIVIPSSVETIEGSAFYGCQNLESIVIPSGVETIGGSAFYGCQKLESIVIPSSVETIKGNAFGDCYKLASVTFEAVVPPSINRTAFKSCKCVASGVFGITVPEGATEGATIEAYGKKCSALAGHIKEAHTYSTKWSYDTNNHWHPANCNHSDEKKDTEAHTYGSEWKSNETKHWHECICGAKSEEVPHSYGAWTVIEQATENREGSQERSCTCGYKQTEVIPRKPQEEPDSGEPGTIETDKKVGENTPDANFGSAKDVLIGAVLTTEDKDLVKAGTDIKIILDIDNIDASVSQSDKQATTDKADGYSVGQYLDINLYKLIGENKEKISKTNGKIRIVIAVPESVKNTDSKKTRSYAVVRVHDGVADLLTDLDNDESTITIETDRFSTYALVYKDSTGSNKNNQTTATDKDLSPATGDDTPIEMCVVLIMLAGLSCLTLFTVNRKKN